MWSNGPGAGLLALQLQGAAARSAAAAAWAASCRPPPLAARAAHLPPSGRLPRSCALLSQVALDVQHHQTMAALQQRVSSRERIVGWFSTGDPDTSRSRDALIHSFYGAGWWWENACQGCGCGCRMCGPLQQRAVAAAGAAGSSLRPLSSPHPHPAGNECPNPVHLALDTSGSGGHMGVRAFVSRALSIGGRELAREFLEVRESEGSV